MRWFRTNLRWGGRLALFALAVQLVLSFGHIHLTDFAAQPARAALAAAPHSPAVPAPAHGTIDDRCPICILMQMAGNSAPSAAPQLSMPAEFDRISLPILADSVRAASPPLLFQARAPPTV